ncbi:hypothetical protein [Streptomyces sp. NPDC102462]|uniref:hypothetical protein n=1 Tax=Streptomyces sp. NPDC102462 TaxID=3366178 RepID=UPI00381BA9C2
MADGDDFYSRDRPDEPELEEDRPRGGGPDGRPQGGHHLWIWWLVAAAVILILFFIFI